MRMEDRDWIWGGCGWYLSPSSGFVCVSGQCVKMRISVRCVCVPVLPKPSCKWCVWTVRNSSYAAMQHKHSKNKNKMPSTIQMAVTWGACPVVGKQPGPNLMLVAIIGLEYRLERMSQGLDHSRGIHGASLPGGCWFFFFFLSLPLSLFSPVL